MVNPYDAYVANKIVDGNQMTIMWHVDDLKILHKSEWEITKIIKWLAKINGDMKVKRGKQHKYLWMNLNYKKPRQVRVSMKHYVDKIMKSFPEEIGNQMASTPVADYLFDVRDEKEAKKLPREQSVQLHHVVAELLFISNKACHDIQTAVAFLSTRVKCPDEDD